jgi:hypothetical protein
MGAEPAYSSYFNRDLSQNRYESNLSEEITPEQIAALLTKKIRGDLGWSETDFNRPLRLPKEKLV